MSSRRPRPPRRMRRTSDRGGTSARGRLKRISLRIVGTKLEDTEKFSNLIVETLKTRGAKVSGPVRLPTKRLILSVRKSPCGEGTPTYDFLELPIYKRLITVELSQRDLIYLVQFPIPKDIHVEFRIS